jgi:predicted DNA-binding helix-hairpin-helix protein
VGADRATDADILESSRTLYAGYGLRRVYYSAFSPIPDASRDLPPQAPPLMREHRLYQADWLMRFYGYEAGEIAAASRHGMLDLEIDPKLAWALANRQQFPVDLNRAPRSLLLRVRHARAKRSAGQPVLEPGARHASTGSHHRTRQPRRLARLSCSLPRAAGPWGRPRPGALALA